MKASTYLTNGTMVEVDGSEEEVTRVLAFLSLQSGNVPTAAAPVSAKEAKKPDGPTGYVLELRDSGFFGERRTLASVTAKLEEGGHVYASNTIAPILFRLVRDKKLRRVKDSHGWSYVWDRQLSN